MARTICRSFDSYCDLDKPDGREMWLRNETKYKMEARAAIAVIARELGEEAIRTIDEFNDPEPITNLVAALRAHFGVPSVPTPREK